MRDELCGMGGATHHIWPQKEGAQHLVLEGGQGGVAACTGNTTTMSPGWNTEARRGMEALVGCVHVHVTVPLSPAP